ncbi:macro domain-containing protein [Rheinheimera sp. SA_1]|uniref:macro domain-containing protein n=1 Tax=Rheinheimera sp. SA_1 TaxID=1827365 RepID=UPI0012FAA5A3|nr:macro domain-containing protein [Rheinheimera sp. SA_1]
MKSILLGLKRHYWRFFASIFLCYSALWTITESIAFFYPSWNLQCFITHLIFIVISVIIGIIRVHQPRRVTIKINATDTIINIYYGDIFKQHGYKAISVNEYFDSELGEPVSENSLHGMVIKQFFGGHPESFDRAVTNDLLNIPFESVQGKRGKIKKYPIGTTAKIVANGHNFLLFALSNTNLQTFKASSDLLTMINAMNGLFERSRNSTGGEKLNIPLIGSGLSGVGLPSTQLLQFIILYIIDETKRRQICKEIDLVLHESRFEEIDLENIQRQWI